jgi:hypothetical protein
MLKLSNEELQRCPPKWSCPNPKKIVDPFADFSSSVWSRSSIHSPTFPLRIFVFCLVVVVRRILNPKSCGTVVRPLSFSRSCESLNEFAHRWVREISSSSFFSGLGPQVWPASFHRAAVELLNFGLKKIWRHGMCRIFLPWGFQSSSFDSCLLLSRISSNGHLFGMSW